MPELTTPKGPGGRPKKAEHERRLASVRTDLTLAEKQYVRDQAIAAGMSEAAYVRQRVLGLPVTVPAPKADAKLLYELNALGNNVNQIARNLNSGREGSHAIDWSIIRDELSRVIARVGATFG